MVFFAAQGNDVLALAEGDAEEGGKAVDHVYGILFAPVLCQNSNGIEGIIKEVRVDLRL